MKRLRSAFFLLLCFFIGIACALAYQHLRKHTSPIAAIGIGDAPPLRGFSLAPPISDAVLDRFPPLHATAAAIGYSANAATLHSLAARIHMLGMKAVLLPSARFSTTNPYPRPLSVIAAEAQAAGFDAVCISWLNADPDPDYWQGQIAAMRKAFSGRLILAATPDLLPGIEFWDQVDLVGAIGPFDLPVRSAVNSRSVELADVRTAWACYLDSLESLAFRYGKKLVLMNAGVEPGRENGAADFDALAYEAVAIETKGRSGTEGLFMNWDTTPDKAAPTAINHSPDMLARISELWLPTATSASAPASATAPDEADSDP